MSTRGNWVVESPINDKTRSLWYYDVQSKGADDMRIQTRTLTQEMISNVRNYVVFCGIMSRQVCLVLFLHFLLPPLIC